MSSVIQTRFALQMYSYFKAGVLRIWDVDDSSGSVFVYRSLTELVRYGREEILVEEELLPGFSLPVADIFRE